MTITGVVSRVLFAALAGRLATMALAGLVLGGLAGHAAMSRPEPTGPLVISMNCYDPATGGWLACSTAVPS